MPSKPAALSAPAPPHPQPNGPQSSTNINSTTRWYDAVMVQQLKASADEADAGQNSPAARWHRACIYARRLVADPPEDSESGGGKWTRRADPVHKLMESQYWLEMIDRKHRKASNLNKYHKFWDEHYTGSENFFYWLDHGAGKDIDLEECPRDRLETQQVVYLTAEQRLNYLVQIDGNGKLVWASDGRPVDTKRGFHKDLGNGRGIVDINPDDLEGAQDVESDDSSDEPVISDDDGSGIIDLGMGDGQQPVTPWTFWGRLKRTLKPFKPSAPSPIKQRKKERKAAEMAAGLRRPKGPKTWIFVVDANAKLYIGLKDVGKFQHSSFLFGARVMAAGLIKVKKGQLKSLVPLSGHYKSGTPHFKRFVQILRESGCDLSHVSINKGLVTIGAIEQYGAMRKRRNSVIEHVKAALVPGHKSPHDLEKQRDEERKEAGRRAEKTKLVWEDLELPHDGRKIEELTMDERIERGAALVARALARGLPDRTHQPSATSEEGQSAYQAQQRPETSPIHDS